MRRSRVLRILSAFVRRRQLATLRQAAAGAIVLAYSASPSIAACSLPYQITNSELGDATQMMANFRALVDCLKRNAPGGAANSIQYNAGDGAFGGLSLARDGGLLVGVTGAAPQAKTLTAGAGILITNSPGGVTVGTREGGLYNQILSATPTSAMTGLSTWLNQGSSVVSNSLVGLSIDAPASVSDDIVARYKAAPTPPYTITTLVAATRSSTILNTVGIGWYDGTSKLHLLSYATNGGLPILLVDRWNNTSTNSGTDFSSAYNDFAQPIWLRIADDGTNVSFSFSQDGSNYILLYSVAKSSGFLGSGGYSNVVFHVNPGGSRTFGTVMSWQQN